MVADAGAMLMVTVITVALAPLFGVTVTVPLRLAPTEAVRNI